MAIPGSFGKGLGPEGPSYRRDFQHIFVLRSQLGLQSAQLRRGGFFQI